MKIIRMLGSTAVAVAALTVWIGVGSASATELDCGESPEVMCQTGQKLHLESLGNITVHPPIGAITCSRSTIEGATANTGSVVETISVPISVMTYTECNSTVTVLKKGELEIHTDVPNEKGNGVVTVKGLEITVVYLGFHCIFGAPTATTIGTLTGSTGTGGHAVLHTTSEIHRTGGSSGAFCGSTAAVTGTYTVTVPPRLNVT